MQSAARPMAAGREALRYRASPRHSQDRKKRPASLRFSQELDELLQWEGLSAIERLAINGFEEDDDLSDISEPSVVVRGSFEDEHHSFLQDESSSDFSELSTMLESAKKKLELLEGNLRGARNSLFIPSLPSPASTASFQSTRPSTAHTVSGSISSNDNDDDPYFEAVRAHSITSAPLQYLHLRRTHIEHAGHARYNSDSKIANVSIHPINSASSSPLRSPRRQLHKTSMDLLREKAKVLGPVTEDEVRDNWTQPSHTRQASSQASIASMQVLRTQAAGVRRSLQKIKRQSLDLSTLADSSRVHDQVTALERTLSRQEEDIIQLEQVVPRTPDKSIRAESLSSTDKQEEYFPNDDFLQEEYDSQLGLHSGSKMYDEESDMEGTNDEYNTNAFDYETFILNSALGNYDGCIERSLPTMYTVDGEAPKYQRTTTEYPTRSSYDCLVRESLATMWPQPPVARDGQRAGPVDSTSCVVETVPGTSSNTSHRKSQEKDNKATATSHTLMNSSQSMLELGKDQDATSVILSALLPASPTKVDPPALAKNDQLLLFTLATALRDTCASLGKSGDVESRRRILAATKLLRGEA